MHHLPSLAVERTLNSVVSRGGALPQHIAAQQMVCVGEVDGQCNHISLGSIVGNPASASVAVVDRSDARRSSRGGGSLAQRKIIGKGFDHTHLSRCCQASELSRNGIGARRCCADGTVGIGDTGGTGNGSVGAVNRVAVLVARHYVESMAATRLNLHECRLNGKR